MMTPSRSKTTASTFVLTAPRLSCSQRLDGWDDLLGEHVELGGVPGVAQPAVPDREAQAVKALELVDGLADAFVPVAEVEPYGRGLLDLVVVPADVVAVLLQHVQLVLHLGTGEQVAGVGVLRDEPQCLLLAASADQDRDGRLAQRQRGVQQPLE